MAAPLGAALRAHDDAAPLVAPQRPTLAPSFTPNEGAPAASEAASPPLDLQRVEVKPPPAIATIDLTIPPDDLWQRVRHGFAVPNLDSPLVLEWQAWYLSRPEYLKRIVERSHRYLYHIVEELEKRGMPTELALLPMVESAFNPMAQSPAKASGIWQFVPSTGRNFQLEQNWWVDERRDIIASTTAALDYLQQIYEMHGDWHLALASYNWGEGAVARAIARNKAKGLPTDYASLSMPAETRNYIPKLQALKNIVARPKLFGINLEAIPNKPYFVTLKKPEQMDVAVAAKLAEMSVEEFKALNPAYNRPVMPATATSIVLPADRADIFRENLENHDQPLVSWRTYTLKKGERLDKVAARFGISTIRLRQVNGLSGHARIAPGRTLLVPSKGNAATTDLVKASFSEDKAVSGKPVKGKKIAHSRHGAKHAAVKKGKARVAARSGAAGRPKAAARSKPRNGNLAARRPRSRS